MCLQPLNSWSALIEMEATYLDGLDGQEVLEEDYDENYEPTEEGAYLRAMHCCYMKLMVTLM